MKKLILTLLAITSSAFASNLTPPETKPDTKTETKEVAVIVTAPCYGIFQVGVQYNKYNPTKPMLSFSYGFQTHPNEKSYFQSVRGKIGAEIPFDSNSSCISIFSQSAAIHYLNSLESKARFFYFLGSGFRVEFYIKARTKWGPLPSEEDKNQFYTHYREEVDSNGYFCLQLGGGVELGKIGTAICGIEGAIEQPLFYFHQGISNDIYKPNLKAGCFVGF